MFRKSFKKGFSLVELLVVITIIAILSVAAYTAIGGQTAKAKNSRRMQDLSTVQNALEIYYVEKGAYPDEVAVTGTGNSYHKTFNTTQLDNKYLSKTPLDPWSTLTKPIPYAYGVTDTKKKYQLAATIEGETANTAYVIGSGTGLIKDKDNQTVTDGGDTYLPYPQPQ